MLIGQYLSTLTEKGRSALPKKFREVLGDNAIVAKWYEGCLVIVSSKDWSGILEKLTAKSEIFSAPVRETDRFILGSAFEVELDSQGRFVIPKILRDYAKLNSEIVFVGLGNRVELWNKEDWTKKEEYVQENASSLVEKLAQNKMKGGDNS